MYHPDLRNSSLSQALTYDTHLTLPCPFTNRFTKVDQLLGRITSVVPEAMRQAAEPLFVIS